MNEAAETLSPDVGDALLVVNLEGFDGPIDLLLHLAREQKVDLAKISMVRLADQYLAYVAQARELRLEIAADYLVMAAWLAYLKSRLLLPRHESQDDEEPTGEELAAALAWQLRRLEAMQQAGARLLALPQLGTGVFRHGMPEGLLTVTRHKAEAQIYDLMSAYAAIRKRTGKPATLRFAPLDLYSIEGAVARLRDALGVMPEWTTLQAFLPSAGEDRGIKGRSALATTLIASLELARQGLLEVRQDKAFGPIWLRRAPDGTRPVSNDNGNEDTHDDT